MKLFWPMNESFDKAFEQFCSTTTNRPFAEEVVAFAQSLSKRFVRMRTSPEIVALGYWLRKANVKQMEEQFGRNATGLRRARGTVFHIAPSNVDTIFVYSWMLSLFAGNRNIVRVSSKEQEAMQKLLTIIVEELAKPEFQTVAAQTIICTYDHASDATDRISEHCHVRVIWGGDETIQAIRHVPLAPLATELVFPDRFSLAAFSSTKIMQLNDYALEDVVERFYNDVFWFDQMACSSPRLIFWTGKEQEQAKKKFWQAFEKKVYDKQYELIAATQVLKYTTALQLATQDAVQSVQVTPSFSRVQLEDVLADVRERHCGGGLFYECDVKLLEDAGKYIVDKDQTLSYFGFAQHEIVSFVDAIATRGIDRIVPVGQALDFDGVWDGQSFLMSFTREVLIIS